MNKKVELHCDVEIEVQASCTPFRRGRKPSFAHAGGSPDEPAEVEDLYVGVVIAGVATDITDKLTPKQKRTIEGMCLESAAEDDRADAV